MWWGKKLLSSLRDNSLPWHIAVLSFEPIFRGLFPNTYHLSAQEAEYLSLNPKLASGSVSLNHCDQRVHKRAMETLYDSRLSPWDLGWNFQIQPASSCPNQISGSWKRPTRQRNLPTVSRLLTPASSYSVRNGRSAPQQRDHTRNPAIWIRGSSSPTETTVRHTRTQ